MQDPKTGLLAQFDSVEEAAKAREALIKEQMTDRQAKVAGAHRKCDARRLTEHDFPIFHKGQPVTVMTPEGAVGTFIIKRLGRRVIRLQTIPRKLYLKMISNQKGG